MSPRARSTATKFVVMALIWVVVQKVFDLTSWGHRESVGELVVTALIFGALMAVLEWFMWERRRQLKAAARGDLESTG